MKNNCILRPFGNYINLILLFIISSLTMPICLANEEDKNDTKKNALPPPVPTITVTFSGPLSSCYAIFNATGCTAPNNGVRWEKDGLLFMNGSASFSSYIYSTPSDPMPFFFKARCYNPTTGESGAFSPETKYAHPTFAEVVTFSPTVCIGGTVTLNASSASSTLTYQWYKDGVSIPTGTGSSITVNMPGNYLVVTNTSPIGTSCTNYSKALTVTYGLPPAPTITWSSAPSGYCNSTLTATGCPPPATNVRWYRNDGGVWNNLGVLGNPIFLPATFDPPEYRATCIIGGCESNPSNVVKGIPNNFTEILPPMPQFCSPGSITLNASSAVSGLSYQWKLGGTNISGATNPTYTTSTTGNYTVMATSPANGCSYTSKFVTPNIVFPPAPSVLITSRLNPTTIVEGESLTLQAIGCPPPATILWSTGATTPTITVSPSINTSYKFTCTLLPCAGVVSIPWDVYVTPLGIPMLSSTSLSTCTGTSVTLTGSCSVGSFLWTTSPVNQNSVITVSPSLTTTYTASCTNGLATSNNGITISVFNGVITSIASGFWNNPSTWSCNCIPASCNDVIVDTGHFVSIQPGSPGSNLGKLKNLALRGAVEIKNNSTMKLK
jgi:hypothetical protein